MNKCDEFVLEICCNIDMLFYVCPHKIQLLHKEILFGRFVYINNELEVCCCYIHNRSLNEKIQLNFNTETLQVDLVFIYFILTLRVMLQ